MKRKILIVEDAPEIQVLLKRLLESEGFEVVCAAHGGEGLNRLESDNVLPDLILLDLMMPVMDGVEFREKQLSNNRYKDIPVIVMTADGNVKAKTELVKAAKILKKPLDVDGLLESISGVMGRVEA